MKIYDDTNSLILNLAPHLVNPVAARLFFFFFCLTPFTLYKKPVIDHCPWPSSQFSKWHAQNKLLSSSLNCHREGAALGSLTPHTSEPLSPQGLFT
jgi:hypothetical protein